VSARLSLASSAPSRIRFSQLLPTELPPQARQLDHLARALLTAVPLVQARSQPIKALRPTTELATVPAVSSLGRVPVAGEGKISIMNFIQVLCNQ